MNSAPEIDRALHADSSHSARPLLLTIAAFLAISTIANAQPSTAAHTPRSTMQQHYEAAFRFQSAGNLSQANSEYKLFLSMVLHRIANGEAHLGEYARAAPLYEEALRFNPDDHDTQVDFAGAALDASDWAKAKALSASVLGSLKSHALPPDRRAVSTLAQALLELGEHEEALRQFKAAAQLNPSFDTFTDLAGAYLVLGDKANAAKILSDLPQKFGDTAALYMQLGTVYGRTRFFDESIEEFKKAIAKDANLVGEHYSLGVSYMLRSGEPAYDTAEAEFHKEIAIDPNNSLVYAPLGRIALSRHNYAEAETDLKRAIALNPDNAGIYLTLGQLYKATGNIPAAKAAFRKSIDLTLDPSRNGFEVEQAHFWLGRLLAQSGDSAEGRKELEISQNLLFLKEQQVQSRLSGDPMLQLPLARTHEANPGDLAAQKIFEKQAGPVIASSYDNLGVNAANAGDFVKASRYFQQAANWNPALRNVDRNWGRATFVAQEYEQAVEPLSRVLALDPAATDIRSMLGLSLCLTRNYARALSVLQPIEAKLDANPQVAIAYAGAMAIAGDVNQGTTRLKNLEEANPNAALVHYLLGETYASRQDYTQAAAELRVSLSLEPSNANVENSLALVDLALDQKADALQLLSHLVESGLADGDVLRRLAKLQIELGTAGEAINSLQAAIRLNPMDPTYHAALAEAYRQNAQPDEAEREARRSETLRAENGSGLQSGSAKEENGTLSNDDSRMRSN